MSWLMPPLTAGRTFVEDAGNDDLDRLAEIHEAAFSRPWSAEDFAILRQEPSVGCLVLREFGLFGGRRTAGFILTRRAADEAEILTIAVEPARRGRGYGRMLVEEAMRRQFRERVASFFLEVDESNEPALKLYRSLGFETVGERAGYYVEKSGPARTALVMRVQLR